MSSWLCPHPCNYKNTDTEVCEVCGKERPEGLEDRKAHRQAERAERERLFRRHQEKKLSQKHKRWIAQVSDDRKYFCSNETDPISQKEIKRRLYFAYREMRTPGGLNACEGCKQAVADDHDHTIAQARCKVLHKTELIWDHDNMEFSCRTCHTEWEGYKSGKFILHANFEKRMAYMKIHDPEGYTKRMEVYLALKREKDTV